MTPSATTTTTSSTSSTRNDGLRHEDPALAYITPDGPYHMTLDEETTLLQQARQCRTALLQFELEDTPDWYSRGGAVTSSLLQGGVSIKSKKAQPNGSPFCLTKGFCDAPPGMTLTELQQQFETDIRSSAALLRTLHRIDPMNLHIRIVTQVERTELLHSDNEQEQLRVLWGSFYVAPLVSDRDFYFVWHTSRIQCPMTGDDVFCCTAFSVLDHVLPSTVVPPDLQRQTGRIRALVQNTGYIFRQQQSSSTTTATSTTDSTSKVRIAFVGQCDPKGLLPASIVNFASISQAMNAGRFRDSFHHCQQVNQLFQQQQQLRLKNSHDKPLPYIPLDGYQLPRRGGSVQHSIPLIVGGGVDGGVVSTSHKVEDSSSALSSSFTLTVHLLAHCDHVITVRRVVTSTTTSNTDEFTLVKMPHDENKGDSDNGTDTIRQFLAGESVSFGGDQSLLDLTFQVQQKVDTTAANSSSRSSSSTSTLELEFVNHGWRKATLSIPATTSITMS
jgi:hypothetical protein